MTQLIPGLQYLKETKRLIKQAIEGKGVSIGDIRFRDYPAKISEIKTKIKLQEITTSVVTNGQKSISPDPGFGGMSRVLLDVNVPQKKIQDTKSVRVTETPKQVHISPDPSYEAMAQVVLDVDVDCPPSAKLQEKTVDITSNGTTEVFPGSQYDGMSKVTIHTDVSGALILQSKQVSVVSNGQQLISADPGYDGMSSVMLDVEVPGAKLVRRDVKVTQNGAQQVTPGPGYDGLSEVVLNVDVPANVQAKSGKVTQNGTVTINPDSGYDGLSKVTLDVNVPANVQAKSERITQNGPITINPDNGYDGMSSVSLDIEVTAKTQKKTITIAENGTKRINPDGGYDGLSEVEIVTNVPTGGGYIPGMKYGYTNVDTFPEFDFSSVRDLTYMMHHATVAQPLVMDVASATSLAHTFERANMAGGVTLRNAGGVAEWTSAFEGFKGIIAEGVDMTGATTIDNAFSSSNAVLPPIDIPNCTNIEDAFSFCRAKSINFVQMGSVTNARKAFYYSDATDISGLDFSATTDLFEAFRAGKFIPKTIYAPVCTNISGLFRLNGGKQPDVNVVAEPIDCSYAFANVTGVFAIRGLSLASATNTVGMLDKCAAGAIYLTGIGANPEATLYDLWCENWGDDTIVPGEASISLYDSLVTNIVDRQSLGYPNATLRISPAVAARIRDELDGITAKGYTLQLN